MDRRLKRAVLANGSIILNGRYEILKCIHSKGMANVYIVQDTHLSKQWCLKEVRISESGKNNIELRSLDNEANILKGLSYERIPRITAIETDNDSHFVVMDFLDGVTLRDYVQGNGKLSEDLAVKWMLQMVQTMGYLHKKSIFYRDMKPDNVMVRANNTINIFDFGISVKVKYKGEKPEQTLGTLGYAPPEQGKRDLPMDLRSDIYSMGLTFYYMLTGEDPKNFIDGDGLLKLNPITYYTPDISPELVKIVDKCIQLNPDDRYQDCEELQYVLENYKSFDKKYRSKSKRRVVTVFSLFLAGLLISIGSIVPFTLNKIEYDKNYDNALIVAKQSGKYDDYNKVISLNPTNLSPYSDYLEIIKTDGVFTKEEESTLLNFINPNLSVIKSDEDYGQIAFEIGKLYWFYYKGTNNDSGHILSIKWFEDAINANYNKDEATVYYNLGVFNKDISKSVTEANDSGMYIKYWQDLIKIQNSNTGDIVTIQTYISIAECISTYVYNLKKDGVSYEEINMELVMLNRFVNTYRVDDTTLSSIKNLYTELKNLLNGLDERVKTIYDITN